MKSYLPKTWDEGKRLRFTVHDFYTGKGEIELEPGVRFFAFWLAAMGAKTIASCEGHAPGWIDRAYGTRNVPWSFYILFEGPQWIAHMAALEFDVSVGADFDTWRIGLPYHVSTKRQRDYRLRRIARGWAENLQFATSKKKLVCTVRMLQIEGREEKRPC